MYINFNIYFHLIEKYWRYLFFLASFTYFIGLIIRYHSDESEEFLKNKKENSKESLLEIILKNKIKILALMFIIGFFYAMYMLSLVFFNSFIPMITNFLKEKMMEINTFLLFLDFLLFIGFAFFFKNIKKEKVMKFAVLCIMIFIFPLFWMLKTESIFIIIFVRTFFVIIMVLFTFPLHAFVQEQVPVFDRFKIVALSFALGSHLIGKSQVFISFWLYKKTKFIFIPAFYMFFLSFFAFLALKYFFKKETVFCKTLTHEDYDERFNLE